MLAEAPEMAEGGGILGAKARMEAGPTHTTPRIILEPERTHEEVVRTAAMSKTVADPGKIFKKIEDQPEPFCKLEFRKRNWQTEFGEKGIDQAPIGAVPLLEMLNDSAIYMLLGDPS